MASEKKMQVPARIPVSLYQRIKSIADSEKRTVTGQIELMLEGWLDAFEEDKTENR